MAKTLGSRTLSISIDCHPAKVYEVVSNPENLPKRARALCKSIKKSNADWLWKRWPIKVRSTEKNALECWIIM